jgi:hypothetical protein
MKNVFTLITLIVTSFSLLAQTMPNAGFETWEEKTVLLTTFEDPTMWKTPNEFTALGSVVVVNKSTDASEGSFSAELETKQIPPTEFRAPGLVTYADFSVDFLTTEFSFSGGLFLQAKVFSLSGKYKFSGAMGDSATALIYSFKHPDGSDIDTMGVGYLFLKDAATWTDFTVNMIPLNEKTPDTFNVLLMSSGSFDPNSIPEGSILHIDDLSIQTNVGIFELPDRTVEVSTYPNPATDVVTFQTAKANDERQVILIDNAGRKVKEFNFYSETISVNVSDLPSGNYSFIASEGGQLVSSGSFIIR